MASTVPSAKMHLGEMAAQFRATADRPRIVVARVGNERTIVRPASDKWSIAHCLLHVVLTTEAYLPVAAGLLAGSHPRITLVARPIAQNGFLGQASGLVLRAASQA